MKRWGWVAGLAGTILAIGGMPGPPGWGRAAEPDPIARPVVAADTNAPPADEKEMAYDDVELLTEALIRIRRQYVEEKTMDEITYGALHGMLRALDPHSDFLEPKAAQALREETRGSFGGIGIQVGMRDGVLTIIAPIDDTPGFRAGLQAGDKILKIDGEKTAGMTLSEAVDRMRGDKGTKVVLTIYSPGAKAPRDVDIIRDEIKVSSVKGARILRDSVGYIRITEFARPTADLLQKALDDLEKQDMKALVLDLRNNPGGLLTAAVEVAQKFLKKGDVIVSTEGRKGVYPKEVKRAGGPVHLVDLPMAILINRGTASAAEIVSGALRDHHRAILVGETSFGKGSVQSLIPMSTRRKAMLRLTVAYYYTPNGHMIHGKGLKPDIPVSMTPEEWLAVQFKEYCEENPDTLMDEAVKQRLEDFQDAEDTVLDRAVDVLQAINILKTP